MANYQNGDILIEFSQKMGRSVKVTAVCAVTGDEVSMVGDAAMPELQLREAAAKKLRFVQNKKYS